MGNFKGENLKKNGENLGEISAEILEKNAEISKIALFGGSFDPPHFAHENIVKMALKSLKIDKLIIMPAFLNPFKSEFSAPPNLRLKWCKILWQNSPKTEICEFEISQNRAVATIESVKFLLEKYPKISKFYLIIGADNLQNLEKWQNYDELKNLVEFVIITRENAEIPPNLQKIILNDKISSSLIRAGNFGAVNEKIKSEVEKFYKGKK